MPGLPRRARRRPDALECLRCEIRYATTARWIDFAPGLEMTREGLGPLLMQDDDHLTRYETRTRGAFCNIMGGGWGDVLTPQHEDTYILEHLRPPPGRSSTWHAGRAAGPAPSSKPPAPPPRSAWT